MYVTNTKNNLKVWYVQRMRAFLRMKSFEYNHGHLRLCKPRYIGVIDVTDIKNTIKYLVNQRDWTGGNLDRENKLSFLLQQVRIIRGPANNLKEYVTFIGFNRYTCG